MLLFFLFNLNQFPIFSLGESGYWLVIKGNNNEYIKETRQENTIFFMSFLNKININDYNGQFNAWKIANDEQRDRDKEKSNFEQRPDFFY